MMERAPTALLSSIRVLAIALVLAWMSTGCAPNGPAQTATSANGAGEASSPAGEPTAAPTQPSMDAPRPARLPNPRVAVIGDSLSVSAEEEIRSALVSVGFEVVGFNAASGRRMVHPSQSIPSGVSAVGELRATFAEQPDMWIVALGTNDVGAQAGRDEMVHDIDTLLAAIGPSTPVLWTNVYIEQLADESWAFDVLVQERSATRSGLAIADWFNPAQIEGSLAPDGIHLTPTGRTRFAGAIASAAARVAGGGLGAAGQTTAEPPSTGPTPATVDGSSTSLGS